MPLPSVRRADVSDRVGKPLPTSFAGGADLQMVKDPLGHGSISTTEKYLHKLSGIA
jgi:hypothetical protein